MSMETKPVAVASILQLVRVISSKSKGLRGERSERSYSIRGGEHIDGKTPAPITATAEKPNAVCQAPVLEGSTVIDYVVHCTCNDNTAT